MAHSYDYWHAYLSKARNGHDRPLGRNRRVIRGYSGDIILRLHQTDVVTLHTDGTETIRTGGWNTHMTRQFIAEHSRARVWTERHQLWARVDQPDYTPPRVTKCRRCHGNGSLPTACYGPQWCYTWGGTCQHGETANHRRETCEHGETNPHALMPVECWQCKGEGRYDYGSKPIHFAWDGGPLRIDAEGNPIESWYGDVTAPQPKMPVYKSHPTAKAGKGYTNSGQMLRAALPGLAAQASCPARVDGRVCSYGTQGLESVIIHLNDTHRWTRESIADWLDTLSVDLAFPTPDVIRADIA